MLSEQGREIGSVFSAFSGDNPEETFVYACSCVGTISVILIYRGIERRMEIEQINSSYKSDDLHPVLIMRTAIILLRVLNAYPFQHNIVSR